MLGFAFVVDRWLTDAGRRSNEFPAKRGGVSSGDADCLQAGKILRGSPAADRASIDALRPNYNWVNIEDQYEISFIREKSAAFARRLPQKGRQSLACTSMRPPRTPAKKSLWQKITAAFSETERRSLWHRGMVRPIHRRNSGNGPRVNRNQSKSRRPRLYVGNLSFDATESDLFELFNGVGAGAERRGRDLQTQPAFERFRLRPNADGGRSETRRERIARQGIPWPQAGRERREIERTPRNEINEQSNSSSL